MPSMPALFLLRHVVGANDTAAQVGSTRIPWFDNIHIAGGIPLKLY